MTVSCEKTRVWCFDCEAEHPGEIFVQKDEARCRVDCPRAPGKVFRLSSDAGMFFRFRTFPSQAKSCRPQFALLHVTDRCSMRCPVCYASSGDGTHLPVADVVGKARLVKAAGIRTVSLTGGEPTEHPALEEIVRVLARDVGLRVALLTNGLAFAADASLAVRLRKAGLAKVSVSFDTLSPGTSLALRGGNHVESKLLAFERAESAGLSLSANVTVCERNLGELGDVFRTLASRFPSLTHVLFQPFADFGRRGFHDRIDRERIVRALAESGTFPAKDADSFIPAPNVQAFGVSVHPDCCAVCAISVHGRGCGARMKPLMSVQSARSLVERLAGIDGRSRMPASLKAACAWVRSAGLHGIPLFSRGLTGGVFGRTVLAVVDNLPDHGFMLAERMERCGSALVCADGRLRPICAAYRMGKEKT